MKRILMLHRVLPKYDSDNYYFTRETAISWNRFVGLLDRIEEEGLQSFTISELEAQSNNNQSIFITFDDGYADNEAALNEILRRKMKVTLFPVKQFVQEGNSPIDDMAFHLMSHKNVSQELNFSLMTGRLKKLLRRLTMQRYRYLRSKWFGLEEDALPSGLFLTEQQLTDLSSNGVELGIHGSSHRVFTSLSSADLSKELSESSKWLNSLGITGKYSICFPHGAHTERLSSVCSDFGSFLLGVDSDPACDSVYRRTHIKEEQYDSTY